MEFLKGIAFLVLGVLGIIFFRKDVIVANRYEKAGAVGLFIGSIIFVIIGVSYTFYLYNKN